MCQNDELLFVGLLINNRVSNIDQSAEDILNPRITQRDDPEYPLRSLHVFVVITPSSRYKIFHIDECQVNFRTF